MSEKESHDDNSTEEPAKKAAPVPVVPVPVPVVPAPFSTIEGKKRAAFPDETNTHRAIPAEGKKDASSNAGPEQLANESSSSVQSSEKKSPRFLKPNPKTLPEGERALRARKVRVFDEITSTSSSSSEKDENESIPKAPVVVHKESIPMPSRGILTKRLSQTQNEGEEDPGATLTAVAAAMASCVKSRTAAGRTANTSEQKTPLALAVKPATTQVVEKPPAVQPTPIAQLQPKVDHVKPNTNTRWSDAKRLDKYRDPGRVAQVDIYDNKDNNDNNAKEGHAANREPEGNVSQSEARELVELIDKYWDYALTLEVRGVAMLFLTVLAMFLTLVGLPLSQVDYIGGSCYTYWGFKEDCDARVYSNRTTFLLCEPIRTRLNVGAVFGCITFAILLIATFGCLLYLFYDKKQLWIPVIVALALAFLCQMVSWVVVANVYGARYCEDTLLPRTSAYGVAFGLSLASWFLILIDIIVALLPQKRNEM